MDSLEGLCTYLNLQEDSLKHIRILVIGELAGGPRWSAYVHS
jgi:hypothetical protein